MSTIHVSLDTTANPPVTCNPKHQPMNSGNDAINWKPAANQSFTFSSLSGLPNPPFTAPIVTDSEITVTDNNQAGGEYPYTLTVMLNGLSYSTAASSPMSASGGDPTIKNN